MLFKIVMKNVQLVLIECLGEPCNASQSGPEFTVWKIKAQRATGCVQGHIGSCGQVRSQTTGSQASEIWLVLRPACNCLLLGRIRQNLQPGGMGRILKKKTALLRYNSHTIKFTPLNCILFSMFTEQYYHQHYIILEHFYPPARNPVPISSQSPCSPSLPQALAVTDLFLSMDLPILCIHIV